MSNPIYFRETQSGMGRNEIDDSSFELRTTFNQQQ